MGMHWGLIAATTPMDVFLDEIDRHTGEFARGPDVGSLSRWRPDVDEQAFSLAVGERDGRSYLLDTSFLLSNMPDALVLMSERPGTVVGGGAETVSGSGGPRRQALSHARFHSGRRRPGADRSRANVTAERFCQSERTDW